MPTISSSGDSINLRLDQIVFEPVAPGTTINNDSMPMITVYDGDDPKVDVMR
jgi:hypothetical protein